MTRARDVADTQDNVGGSVPPSVAGKNAVINGGFDIWQRGTSNSVATNTIAYTADRWEVKADGLNSALTISRQSTGDTTNLPNIQYCARVQRNSGQTGTGVIYFAQPIETVNSIPFAGKTVTLSFYARAGANYSGGNLSSNIDTGTGTDQNPLGTWTGGAVPVNTGAALTTTWQRFSATGTIAATATEMAVRFNYTPSGTAGANDYFEVTGVQLELGNVATPFSRAGGTIQGELAACQRYYVRYLVADGYAPINSYGVGYSASAIQMTFSPPVTMRTNIATLEASGLVFQDVASGANINVVSASINRASDKSAHILFTGMSGITAYRQYTFYGNGNANAYLALGAEL